MLYTIEQIEAARKNITVWKHCHEWMQEMFAECPNDETFGISSGGHLNWSTGWEGDDPEKIYRISDNWPEDSSVFLEVPVPLLSEYECEVSDDKRNWEEEIIIGYNNEKYITIDGVSWNYARKINPYRVTLADGKEVYVSKEAYEQLEALPPKGTSTDLLEEIKKWADSHDDDLLGGLN